MATVETLMTAELFGQRPDPGHSEELICGRIVAMPPPGRRHGYVCVEFSYVLRHFLEGRDLGRVLSNDSGVVTERDPDTVRGADVAYYSYARLPKGAVSAGYGPEVPEIVVEVLSPSDRWSEVLIKVTEYLEAGVLVVVVLDPESRFAHVFGVDVAPQILKGDDELTFPGILEGFAVRVGRFFE